MDLSCFFKGDVKARLVTLDREFARHEARSDEQHHRRHVRIGVFMRHLPEGALRQHLVLSSAGLTSWVCETRS